MGSVSADAAESIRKVHTISGHVIYEEYQRVAEDSGEVYKIEFVALICNNARLAMKTPWYLEQRVVGKKEKKWPGSCPIRMSPASSLGPSAMWHSPTQQPLALCPPTAY